MIGIHLVKMKGGGEGEREVVSQADFVFILNIYISRPVHRLSYRAEDLLLTAVKASQHSLGHIGPKIRISLNEVDDS